jgi:hypothetical protein
VSETDLQTEEAHAALLDTFYEIFGTGMQYNESSIRLPPLLDSVRRSRRLQTTTVSGGIEVVADLSLELTQQQCGHILQSGDTDTADACIKNAKSSFKDDALDGTFQVVLKDIAEERELVELYDIEVDAGTLVFGDGGVEVYFEAPTEEPSTSPTAAPTHVPSNYPSSSPSSQPSSQPSSTPAPTTLSPSPAPTLTFYPTPNPTEMNVSLGSFFGDFLDMLEGEDDVDGSASEETPSYGLFRYNDKMYGGTCDSWTTLRTSGLTLPFSSMYISALSAEYYSFNLETLQVMANGTRSCTNRTALDLIIPSLRNAYASNTNCDGGDWRVFLCGSEVSFCIDCEPDCTQTACPGQSSTAYLNPCKTCNTSGTGYYFLESEYSVEVLYPQINLPIIVEPSKTSLRFNVNVTRAGRIYCEAVEKGSDVGSVLDIKSNGAEVSALGAGVYTLDVVGLSPATTYDTYCYTEDYKANSMELATVLETFQNVTTSCCKSLIFSETHPSIPLYEAGVSESVYQVMLDAAPADSITVSLTATATSCASQDGTTLASAVISPSTVTFTSESPSLTASFVVRGTLPGCITLGVSAEGETYDEASTNVVIRNSVTPPEPPVITSAVLSTQGHKMTCTFDSDTDRGETIISDDEFTCSQALSFSGAESSTCIWTSKRVIVATLEASSTGTYVEIGDAVTALSDVMKPDCIASLNCTYGAASNTTVVANDVCVQPYVSLSSADLVGACADIVLDPTGTTGKGNRDWMSVEWFVSAVGEDGAALDDEAQAVEDYLNANAAFTNAVITIDNGDYLSPGTIYTFTLQVQNFFGKIAATVETVSVSTDTSIPTLSIAGPRVISMTREQKFDLRTVVEFSSCHGDDRELTYQWSTYAGAVLADDIQSVSLSQRVYKVTPYTYSASTTYSIVVQVFSATSPGVALTSASVTVNVGSQGMVASIAGGDSRVVGLSDTIVLDGSGSYDIDEPSASVSFVWSCMEVAPNYGDACNLGTVDLTSSIITFPAVNISSGDLSEARFEFTMFVTNAAGVSESDTATIIVLNSEVPKISMGEVSTKYNADRDILFSATVDAQYQAVATWSSEGFDLAQDDLYTSVSKTLQPGLRTYEIRIKPHTLTKGKRYTFQLGAYYVFDDGQSVDSFSTVDIQVNSPPVLGKLLVEPTNGTAQDTSFYMLTYDWIDDAADAPIR